MTTNPEKEERAKIRARVIDDLKGFAAKTRDKYKVQRMILFGSTARGEAGPDSDLDILLVSETFNGKSALKRPVPFYMEWWLDYPVDFLCFTPEEFDSMKNRATIVRAAIREGVEITG